jgi:flagellar biosynthesis/type III secretory pathway chaperone
MINMSMFDMALFLLLVALAALLVRCFYSISDLRDSNRAIKRMLEAQIRSNESGNRIMNSQQELESIREDSHEQ